MSADRDNELAVFDADSPPALAFVRSVGARQIPVRVYSTQRGAVAAWSRHCSARSPCPELSNARDFLPWLRSELRRGAIRAIAPTSDLIAFYLTQVWEDLPAAFRSALPEPDAALDQLFKDRFRDRCEAHGQPIPWGKCPISREQALDGSDDYAYPVILKPRSHVGVGWHRGVVVHNRAELEAAYQPYAQTPQTAPVLERYPQLRWPLIEQYVPSALDNLYSISGLLGANGQTLAVCGSRKIAQWPPKLGIGILFESHDDPDLIERGTMLARKLIGRGLFELEFIFDTSRDEYVAVDLNPRAHGHVRLDIARGLDLPWMWHQLSRGQPLDPVSTNRPGKWIHGVPYTTAALTRLARAPQRRQQLEDHWRNLRGNAVDVISSANDPLPTIAFVAKMLRHPGSLIRPFLRESR